MKKPMIKIHDVATDKIIEREMTDKEFSQFEIDKNNYELVKATKQAEAEAKATKRAELLSKLGITEEEARILLG